MTYPAEVAYPLEGAEKHRFDFSGWIRNIDEKIPSLDKSLDRYFDRYMESIIEEWELLTDADLARMENRLKNITEELNRLGKGHSGLKERVLSLDASVKELEAGR